MTVSAMTFWAVVSAGGAIATTISTAVYANRKNIRTMNQRLFGMDSDETDRGAIQEIENKIDGLARQMDEQHEDVREIVEEIRDEQRREN